MSKKRRSSRSSASGRRGGSGGPSGRSSRPGSARRNPAGSTAVGSEGASSQEQLVSDEPAGGDGRAARGGKSRIGRGASALRAAATRRSRSGSTAMRAAPRRTELRAAVEQRSAGPLRVLSGLPRWALPAIVGVLLFLGLFLRNFLGTLLLLVVGAFLVWLTFLSWPRLNQNARLLRVALLGLFAGVFLAITITGG